MKWTIYALQNDWDKDLFPRRYGTLDIIRIVREIPKINPLLKQSNNLYKNLF